MIVTGQEYDMNAPNNYSKSAKLIHLGLAAFGIAAFLTGELAEGDAASTGYLLHSYLGLSLAAVMLTRLIAGMSNSEHLGFRHWHLFGKVQFQQLAADISDLLHWRIPEGTRHGGLAGLVQALGLMIFSWMSITGTGMYFINEATRHDLFEVVEEAHEIGAGLIPVYLLLHVGAVALHSLVGKPVWQHMFRFQQK
jgi:cytochrome b561